MNEERHMPGERKTALLLMLRITMRLLKSSAPTYLRGALFYLPVLLICLVLVSTGRIRLDNQRAFLRQMTYAGIYIEETEAADAKTSAKAQASAETDIHAKADIDAKTEINAELKTDTEADTSGSGFRVYDTMAAAGEERRDLLLYTYQYPVQIFTPLSGETDYDLTYFRNLTSLQSGEHLGSGEAAVSYDTARALHLKEGDDLLILDPDSAAYLPVTIKEIFPTKYRYGQIGECGTVLVGRDTSSSSELEELLGAGYGVTFLQETPAESSGTTWISLEEELAECTAPSYLSQILSEGINISLLFPVLGLLLLLRIALRELSQQFHRLEYTMAVWLSLGCSSSVWKGVFFLTEGMKFWGSALIALILYKYLFVQLLVGEYLRLPLLLSMWGSLIAASLPVLLICIHRLGKSRRVDLAAQLTESDRAGA